MDVTPHLHFESAAAAVFRLLPERRGRVRFVVRRRDGDDRVVLWDEMAASIRALGRGLLDAGLGPGERGAVFAANSVEWFFAALAIEATGAAMVPVYPTTTVDGLGYMLDHGDVTVLFVEPALLERALAAAAAAPRLRLIVVFAAAAGAAAAASDEAAAGTGARITTYAALQQCGAAADAVDPSVFDRRLDSVDVDAPAVMLYTSGTTGRPKAVPLSHRNVGVNGCDWLRCYGPLLEEGMVDLLWLPLSHIFGFGEACLGNTLGFESHLCTPAEVAAALPEVRPQVFMSVPAVWDAIAQRVRADDDGDEGARLRRQVGDRLRFCLSGGAGLDGGVKALFRRHGMPIFEGYGLTEASPTLTLNRPDRWRDDSVGVALPSVELRLAHDGEILARGASIFAGYHKDPEATAATLDADGWLHTGDLGRLDGDGFLQIIGRKKEILVTAGGKNVPPVNIESLFAASPHIERLVVHGDGRRFLVALVWLHAAAAERWCAGDAHARAALQQAIQGEIDAANAGLDRYLHVRRFAIVSEPLSVEAGTLTATLKLRRNAIDARFAAELEELYR